MAMDMETLRQEAKKQGYYLVKIPSYTRILPCTCGSQRRKCWISAKRGKVTQKFVCIRCGKEGPESTSADGARQAWNRMIEEETNGSESR